MKPPPPAPRVSRIGLVAYALVHVAAVVGAVAVGVSAEGLALCAALYFLRMFGITAGFHRYFSHRAYKTSRGGQLALAVLGGMAAQRGVLWWASHHRKHHRHSDTGQDAHSPRQHGFLWAHVGWFLAAENHPTDLADVRDLARYPELVWLDRHYLLPPALLAGLLFAAAGWTGLIWGFGVSTVLCWHCTYLINSCAHLVGARRYATPDDSRNSLILALLTMGEGWHNNHHHYPGAANQGFFWWEIDPSYRILRILAGLGLIWDLRAPSAQVLSRNLCNSR